MMQEIERALLDLVAIAQRRKSGQVTHQIENIKELINQHVAEVIGEDKHWSYGADHDCRECRGINKRLEKICLRAGIGKEAPGKA